MPHNVRILIALAATLTVGIQPADAQLGGLIKRGAEKAAEKAVDKKVEPKARPAAPTFDDDVLELTSARLDQMAKGLRAWQGAIAKADVPGKRKVWEDAMRREEAFSEPHHDHRQEYREKVDEHRRCRDDAFLEQDEANQRRIDKRMEELRGDPATLTAMARKLQEWNPKLMQLQQKGDTAGYRAAAAQMQAEVAKVGGIEMRVDSAAVDRKCGNPPAKPAWLKQWEEAEAVTQQAGDTLRAAESAGDPQGAAAAGLTERQFMVARERIEAYVRDGNLGYSERELSGLKARKAEFSAFFPK